MSLFTDVKSIQAIPGFNLKRMKKMPDGAAVQKYQKQILKQWYLHYWHAPRGVKKFQKSKLKTTLVSWSANIQPKLNKIIKTFRKQGFFDNFCSILTIFHSFFNFGWILALQLTREDFSLVVLIFWHPSPCPKFIMKEEKPSKWHWRQISYNFEV